MKKVLLVILSLTAVILLVSISVLSILSLPTEVSSTVRVISVMLVASFISCVTVLWGMFLRDFVFVDWITWQEQEDSQRNFLFVTSFLSCFLLL